MRKAPVLAVISVIVLAGCTTRPQPTPVEDVPEAPTVECLEISSGALAGIQWGLDDRNGAGTFKAVEGVAIKNPSSDASWFVAARFTGQGVDSVGVWTTMTDPATAPDTVGYSSVDAYAEEFSSYERPANYSSALDGVDEVRDCLD